MRLKRERTGDGSAVVGGAGYALRNALSNVEWPAFVNPKAAQVLAMLWQLEHTQWLPAETLRSFQFAQARNLLGYAFRHSPFYRVRLEAAGFDPQAKALEERVWSEIAPLTRAELQSEPARIVCGESPKDHGRSVVLSSSGSTGRPVSVARTEMTFYVFDALALRDHFWYETDFSLRFAAIRFMKQYTDQAGPPDGLQVDGWGGQFDTMFHTGDSRMLSIYTPVEEQVDWLERVRPAYLLTYPSNLRALARAFERRKRSLGSLYGIRTTSETLDAETREYCEAIFEAPISDVYSCEEIGYLAAQCPEHPHYHVFSEHVLLEILNADGEPCRPGEHGRVVVTDLHNYAMPLIRYELGDYAEAGEDCPCGRGLPVLTRILGRVRNMLTLPDGRQFRPSPRIAKYSEVAGATIEQAQVVQRSLESIEVKLVCASTLAPRQEDALRSLLNEALMHSFDVEFTYHREIPRSASGKFEDFLSLVESG